MTQNTPPLSTVLYVQIGIALALGLLGIAGAMWSAISLATSGTLIASGTMGGIGGLQNVMLGTMTLQGIDLVVGLILSVLVLAGGTLALLRERVSPFLWGAIGCVVYNVVFGMVVPMAITVVMFLWYAPTASTDPMTSVIMFISPAISLVIALIKAGFWGWTAYTALAWTRAHRLDEPAAAPTG